MRTTIMRGALGVSLVLALSACGTWQSVKDGTASTTKAIFETKVKQMNLVVTARGVSLPVVLRIYQLKDDKPFATATYDQVLGGSDALKAATLWSRDVTLGPGQRLELSEPMDEAANYVGVAAFYRNTDSAEWSVLVPKAQWKKTDPVRLLAAERSLEIDPERR